MIFGCVFRIVLFNLLVGMLVKTGVKLTVIPCVLSDTQWKRHFGVFWTVILVVVLFMLEWSWIAVITMDSGRLDHQIKKWGIESIKKFASCNRCGLPKPPRCHHCSKCGHCMLYMDHHCKPLGTCLAFRNFKAFMLVLFYGSVASGIGSTILLFSSIFGLTPRRLEQFVFGMFDGLIAAALAFFASFYLKLKRNNLTTIETMMSNGDISHLPNTEIFENGWRQYLPLPSTYDPFNPFHDFVFL